jgi:hypothetical protein
MSKYLLTFGVIPTSTIPTTKTQGLKYRIRFLISGIMKNILYCEPS